jgi:hypothetical protein
MLVICDIDITLTQPTEKRLKLIAEPTPDWKAFLDPEIIKSDLPIPTAQAGLDFLQQIGAKLVFLTGRGEALRESTQEWLLKHYKIKANSENLYMRKVTDTRIPSEYKTEHLQTIKSLSFKDYNSIIAIDDDPYMVKVYFSMGILPLSAPDCWKHMFKFTTLPEEIRWRL